jgi:hypothetical protein
VFVGAADWRFCPERRRRLALCRRHGRNTAAAATCSALHVTFTRLSMLCSSTNARAFAQSRNSGGLNVSLAGATVGKPHAAKTH